MGCNISSISSPPLVLDTEKRSIDWKGTIVQGGKLTPAWGFSVRTLSRIIRQIQPDLIVNFYEPTASLCALYMREKIPVLAIAHQFMFLHYRYPKPTGHKLEQQFLDWYTNLIGRGSHRKLALSLYDAPDITEKNLRVVPPLLRDDILGLSSDPSTEPFFLTYLSRPDMLPELVNWQRQYPDVRVHCYRHEPAKPEVVEVARNLTVHQLDDTGFIRKMAACSGMATTAGFETTSEAMYLGKPLLMVPMHLEQKCNALDSALMNASIIGTRFWLGRLVHFSKRYEFSNSEFRQWVHSAREVYLREIEAAAYGRTASLDVASFAA